MKKALNIIFNTVSIGFFLLAVVIAFSFYSAKSVQVPFKLFTVMSGSMEPKLPIGSLITASSQNQYQIGDIISYKTPDGRRVVTHRIVEKTVTEDSTSFMTKGDANNTRDPYPVTGKQILGKVALTVPYLGYPISFARSFAGLILLVIIPSSFIIFMEINSLKKAVLEELNNRKINDAKWYKLNLYHLIFLLSFLLGFVTVLNIKATLSYLTDTASIEQNVFTAATSFTPITLTLSNDKKIINLKVNNIKNYIKISYTLTYDSDSGDQGVIGEKNLVNEESFERTIELATCSENGCVYHTGVKNFLLKVKLKDAQNQETNLETSL